MRLIRCDYPGCGVEEPGSLMFDYGSSGHLTLYSEVAKPMPITIDLCRSHASYENAGGVLARKIDQALAAAREVAKEGK